MNPASYYRSSSPMPRTLHRQGLRALLAFGLFCGGVPSLMAQDWVGNFHLRSPSWTYYDDVTGSDKFQNFDLNLHQIGDAIVGTMIWDIGEPYAREEYTANGHVRPDGRLFLLRKDDEFDPGVEMVLEYDAGGNKISGISFNVSFLTEDETVWEIPVLQGKWYDIDHPSYEANDPRGKHYAAESYGQLVSGERVALYTGIFQEPRSVSLGGGFYWNGMGYLFVNFYPWVYVWGYGWIYVVGQNEENFYVFDTVHNHWGWTHYGIYPWYFCVSGDAYGQAYSF